MACNAAASSARTSTPSTSAPSAAPVRNTLLLCDASVRAATSALAPAGIGRAVRRGADLTRRVDAGGRECTDEQQAHGDHERGAIAARSLDEPTEDDRGDHPRDP